MVELVDECGYEGVAVRPLVGLAGISTRSFYKLFPTAEECFASTYESLMRQSLHRAYAAQSGSGDREAAVRASIRAIVEDVAGNRKAARLVLVEAFAGGPGMQLRMRGAIAGFEGLLADTFADAPEKFTPSRHIIRGIAGGVMRVVRARLLAGRDAQSREIADQLGDWVLSLLWERSAGPELTDLPPFEGIAGVDDDGIGEDRATEPSASLGDETGRLFAAAARLELASGFSELTIPRIRTAAGVSRRSFDARFADVGECFLGAIEATTASAVAHAARNTLPAGSWEGDVYLGIQSLCAEVAGSQSLSRLAFLDIFAPGRTGLQRRERLVSLGATRLGSDPSPDRRLGDIAAEASSGAAWRIAHADVSAGRAKRAHQLAPVLTYVALAASIGPLPAAEAIREEQLQST